MMWSIVFIFLYLFYVFGIVNEKKIGLFIICNGVDGYCCGFRKVGVDFDVFLMYKVYNLFLKLVGIRLKV